MTTMTRQDEHRPAAIDPEDYEYVAQECVKIEGLGDCSFILAERAIIKEHMARTGGTYSGHEHGGNCGVCGSVNAIYTVLFYHQKTNSYVRMGKDCAGKLEMGDPRAFKAFQAGVDDYRKAHAGKAKAQALLAEAGLSGAWTVFMAEEVKAKSNVPVSSEFEERTIRDIVHKLIQYGSLSDKQLEFLHGLVGRIETRAARMAQREIERAAAPPCPTGRTQITGTVISIKEYESDFGQPYFKMTVKSDLGWMCYGTVPRDLMVERGQRISFRGTLTPSDRDPKFGFFKRPACAVMVTL